MVYLYKDPKGENIFQTNNTKMSVTFKLGSSSVDSILKDGNKSEKEKIDLLAARLREVESRQAN